jgi:hypothetical protein
MWRAVLEENPQRCQDIFLNNFFEELFTVINRRKRRSSLNQLQSICFLHGLKLLAANDCPK